MTARSKAKIFPLYGWVVGWTAIASMVTDPHAALGSLGVVVHMLL